MDSTISPSAEESKKMSTRKRSKSSAVNVDAEPETPSRVTRSKTPSKSKVVKETTPRKKLVDDENFRKESSESDEDTGNKSAAQERGSHAHHEEIHYEFGGPIGALGVIVGLPVVIYMLYFLCNDQVCMRNPLSFDWTAFFAQIDLNNFFSREATIMYLGWMAFSVVLERVLPGEYVEGTILPNTTNKRLGYTMSGHLQFWVSLIAAVYAIPLVITTTDADSWLQNVYQIQGFAPVRLELIYDHYVQLITISVVFTTIMSFYL